VATAVAEFGLHTELDRYPSELAYAQRRLLAITRAIAARPRILLLDEPAAGLGEHEREELSAILRRLATTWRMAIVLIEHDVELVMELSDRVLALDFGKVVAYDSPEAVRTHPEVVRSYLGLTDDDDDTDLDQRVTRDRRD
jgi:ABC-type branched-subunit amino acid transport system ATPase component